MSFPLWVILLLLGAVALVLLMLTAAQHRRHSAQTDIRLCRSCGTNHPPFAIFCRRCGGRL